MLFSTAVSVTAPALQLAPWTGALAALLAFQIALVSPDAARTGSDLLPREIGNWAGGAPSKYAPQAVAEFSPSDAAVLEEYGFQGAERRIYKQGSRSLTIEVSRMRDATGAYGAFTYYRRIDWRAEIGTGAPPEPRKFFAAVGPREAILFRNSFLVRFTGEAPSRKELVAVTAVLPSLSEEALPYIKEFLPRLGVAPTSLKYVIGPVAFKALGSPIPPSAIGFESGAEVETAEYRLPGKAPARLMLILYPTPQIALAREKLLGVAAGGRYYLKRNSALLGVVVGPGSQADADHLLDRIRYAMDITWNQGIARNYDVSIPDLIVGTVKLCAYLALFCVLSGFGVFGLRRLFAQVFPDLARREEGDVIRLNLEGRIS